MKKLKQLWEENKPTIGDILKWAIKSLFITIIVVLIGAAALPPLMRNILGAVFKPVIKEVVQEELAILKTKMEGLEKDIKELKNRLEYTYNWTINFEINRLNKQYQKIRENPGDIYEEDIIAVVTAWASLPEGWKKSPLLTKKYQLIEEYYYNMEIN